MSLEWTGPFNSGAAVGADGAATANATSSVRLTGKVHAIYLKYNGSPPAATTDAIVTTGGTSPMVPAATILNIQNSATDAMYYPRVQVCNTSGTGLTLDGTRLMVDKIGVDDLVNVQIVGANAADTVDAWVCLER